VLTLRPSIAGDLHNLTGWEAEPDTALWLGETGPSWHARALADPDQDHLIALEAAVPVGFAVIAGLSGGRQLELRRMLLRPASRGKGSGRSLLEAALAWAYQHRGAEGVWLDVKAHNHRARALYESAGFTVTETLTGAITEADGSWSDLIVMAHQHYGCRVPGIDPQ
jgi:diamine N-acetyltransferase